MENSTIKVIMNLNLLFIGLFHTKNKKYPHSIEQLTAH